MQRATKGGSSHLEAFTTPYFKLSFKVDDYGWDESKHQEGFE